jgi:hypothetical protein
VRAEIERRGERLHIGDAPAADPVARLNHREAHFRIAQPPRGGNTGGAGADDRDRHIGNLRANADRRRGKQRSRPGNERTAREPRHGIRMVEMDGQTLPQAAQRRKSHD